MPKKTRADLHERFAAWLEGVTADRANEFEEIIGYHLERSCRLRLELGWSRYAIEGVAQRAAAHLESSGRRAYDRGDITAAVNLLSRAAGLGEQEGHARLSMLPDIARGYFELARFDEADVALSETISGARAIGDRGLEERAVLIKLFNGLFTDPTGDLSRVRERARRATLVTSDARDDRTIAFAWSLFGLATYFMGNAAEGEDALRQAIAYARSANDRTTAYDSVGWLPIVVTYGPTPVSHALARFAELRAGEETAALAGMVVSWLLEQEGILWAMQGDFTRARANIAAVRATYQELGLTMSAASSATAMAQIDLLRDDPGSAENALRVGEEALQAIGESGSRSTIAALRAEALYRLGRYEESIAASNTSEALAWPDDLLSQVVWRGARGKSVARLGDPATAELLCHEALKMIEASDYISTHADTLVSVADVLRLQGKDAEATRRLREALALYERKENLVSAEKVRALLA
jgi:tetratricopeptide (TPR) repeat protein